MKKLATALLLSWGIATSLTITAKAQSPATPPEELTEIISGLEQAANERDLEEITEYYSPDFINADGLNRDSMTKALAQMWKTYPRIRYTTEIESWERNGDELIAETVTKIRGVRKNQGRTVRFDSTLRSRQTFKDEQIIEQDILSEQTKLTSGENPPQINVYAPETVEVGEKYNFDVVVAEPLGDRILLGAVKEDRVGSDIYLNPTALELEPLAAGGIYKVVTAPLLPDSNLLSAILIRGDGITMVTQRVNVKERGNQGQGN